MVRIGFRALVAMVAIVLATRVSLAQRPGGFGGGFGGPGGGNNGNLNTLNLEAVQKELEITDEQKEKLKKLGEDVAKEMRDQFSGFRDLSREDREKKMEELQAKLKTRGEEIQKEVDAVLTPAQRVRLKQVAIQIQGTRALDSKEVQEALGITDEQKEKITKIREESRAGMRDLFQPGGNREEAQKKMEEARKATEEKLTAVLTDAQKTKYEQMKGKKFEFDRTQLFGGRGGNQPGGNRPGGNRPGGNQPAPEKKDL